MKLKMLNEVNSPQKEEEEEEEEEEGGERERIRDHVTCEFFLFFFFSIFFFSVLFKFSVAVGSLMPNQMELAALLVELSFH